MLRDFEGVVLRSRDYGESHKILTVFTPHLGKLSLMARGAKKPKSRLRASGELLTRSLFYVYYRGEGLETLNQCEVLESYSKIKADLHLYAYALYTLELLERLTEERESVPGLYQDLLHILSFLQEGKEPEVLKLLFQLRMLGVAGYRPHLEACVRCGRKTAGAYISAQEGGVLCSACSEMQRGYEVTSISAAALELLRRMQALPIGRLGQVNLGRPLLQELDQMLSGFTLLAVGKPLNSQQFLSQVKEWGEG